MPKSCCVVGCSYNKGKSRANTARRTLLSEAYQCREAWQKRLEVPLLQTVDVGNFLLAVQGKLDKENQVKALDMDILANKLEQVDRVQIEFVQNLFYRFRHTNAALHMSDATQYSLIRALLDLSETDRLITILQDKVNYGIFLNDYSANILMDHFIKKDMYKEAAFIACDLMLQEELSHPICRYLAWYACHLRCKNLPDEATPEAPEEGEMEYVRVKFIENPFYDDHFDINRESLLLGKTLVQVTKNDNSTLALSYHLTGLGLYEKFDKGLEFMQQIIEGDTPVSQEAIQSFENSLVTIVTKEPPEEEVIPGLRTVEDERPYVTEEAKQVYTEKLQKVKSDLASAGLILKDFDLERELRLTLEIVIKENQDGDIQEQLALFHEWEKKREVELKDNLEEARIDMIKKDIVERLMKLQDNEERLSYFDEIDQIELKMRGPPPDDSLSRIQEEEHYVAAPGERGKSK